MDLAGPPYHIPVREALQWTLPQILYAWVRKQEDQAADARQTFQLTQLAIGASFAKGGDKIIRGVMAVLEGGGMTDEDLMAELSEEAKLVLFGSKRLGSKANTDTHRK